MQHFYENIRGYFDYQSLFSRYVAAAKDGDNSIEIGVFLGRSTAYMGVEIINSQKNIKHYALDHFLGNPEHQEKENPNYIPEIENNEMKDVFLKNIEPVKNVIVTVAKDSIEASKDFENNFFQFIFIDGHHGYEESLNDIKMWWPKLKNGGIMAGHDLWTTGVSQAVKEFFNNKFYRDSTGCWLVSKK